LLGSDFVPLAQASSLCGACKDACPVDIDLPRLLTRVRAGESEMKEGKGKEGGGLSGLGKLFLQMYSLVARNPRLFTLSQKIAALGTRLVSPFGNYVHLPAFTGWGYSKDLPRFAGKTFRDRFAQLKVEDKSSQVNTNPGEQVKIEESKSEQRSPDRSSLISQFTQELIKVNGNLSCTPPDELTQNIIGFLKTREIDQIHLESNVVDEIALEKAGITVRHAPDPALRVGVTKAICGLADTGSILIADGEGNPLQASLLPEIHIAVLRASDILPSLADAMPLPIVRQSRAAVFITGPSRTADIEMSLTIGMHGPGEVHVFLVHSTASTLVDD
jgi:L-lactate utilization protein LutC